MGQWVHYCDLADPNSIASASPCSEPVEAGDEGDVVELDVTATVAIGCVIAVIVLACSSGAPIDATVAVATVVVVVVGIGVAVVVDDVDLGRRVEGALEPRSGRLVYVNNF